MLDIMAGCTAANWSPCRDRLQALADRVVRPPGRVPADFSGRRAVRTLAARLSSFQERCRTGIAEIAGLLRRPPSGPGGVCGWRPAAGPLSATLLSVLRAGGLLGRWLLGGARERSHYRLVRRFRTRTVRLPSAAFQRAPGDGLAGPAGG